MKFIRHLKLDINQRISTGCSSYLKIASDVIV